MMKKVMVALAIGAGVLGASTSNALAFDCIRVSSSLQGLQNSTRSGNWALFDLSSASAVQATAARMGQPVSPEQAACVADQYAESGFTPYFALGVGVAGGRTGHGSGVLAGHAPDKVLSNLHGIDHLDDSPIGQAFFGALGACGLA